MMTPTEWKEAQLKVPENLPSCFADYQFNHAYDRKCAWCELKTKCKTGEQVKEKPLAWKHYTKPLERRLQHLEAKGHQNSFDKHEISALRHVLGIVTKTKFAPLTLEQLREHWQVAMVLDMTDAEIDFSDYVLIARDIEALHGIKEEA